MVSCLVLGAGDRGRPRLGCGLGLRTAGWCDTDRAESVAKGGGDWVVEWLNPKSGRGERKVRVADLPDLSAPSGLGVLRAPSADPALGLACLAPQLAAPRRPSTAFALSCPALSCASPPIQSLKNQACVTQSRTRCERAGHLWSARAPAEARGGSATRTRQGEAYLGSRAGAEGEANTCFLQRQNKM